MTLQCAHLWSAVSVSGGDDRTAARGILVCGKKNVSTTLAAVSHRQRKISQS